MTTVRCTIEMELVEGRDFKVPEFPEGILPEQAAEIVFIMMLRNENFNIYDYTQTKIVDDVI